MSATPIPRSLALALHGDLDASFLVERPAGRSPAATTLCLTAAERDAAYARLRDAVAAGAQAFVVCPVREVGRRPRARGDRRSRATPRRLARELRPARVGLLHGGLSSADKEAALRAFAVGRDECSGGHDGCRAGDRRAQRDRDDRRGRRPLRPGAAAPAARPRRARRAPGRLLAVHRRRADHGRGARAAGAGGGAPTTASRWPRPIWRSGARATSTARARRVRRRWRPTAWPRWRS